MCSLILPGRRFLELQKWRNLRSAVNLFQNESAFSYPFSSASAVADVTPSGRKGKNFTVSYLVSSLGLTTKLAESISRKVSFEGKGNPDSVVSLLRSHGFSDSQISTIITDYPKVLIADAEKSLAPKLQFLQSRGASTSELTEILSKVPKILGKKGDKTLSRYYGFVKDIIEADKRSTNEKSCQSFPHDDKLRNVMVLRELGVSQDLLFSLLISDRQPVCDKENFDESLKKVVKMGFDPTTLKFVRALQVFYDLKDETIEEKVNVYKRLGFAVEDVWGMFKKYPSFLSISEKKILNSIETFTSLGFSRDDFAMMVKNFPSCLNYSAEAAKQKTEFIVNQMKWPRKAVALFPQVLGYNFEKRTVPRCKVIKTLLSRGLLGRSDLPPIQSVLAISDQAFLNKYVNKHDDKELVAELMAIFTGGRVS